MVEKQKCSWPQSSFSGSNSNTTSLIVIIAWIVCFAFSPCWCRARARDRAGTKIHGVPKRNSGPFQNFRNEILEVLWEFWGSHMQNSQWINDIHSDLLCFLAMKKQSTSFSRFLRRTNDNQIIYLSENRFVSHRFSSDLQWMNNENNTKCKQRVYATHLRFIYFDAIIPTSLLRDIA